MELQGFIILIKYRLLIQSSSNVNCASLHIPEHTRSLSGSLLGYKTIP